jgi:hypothetical protein
MPDRRTLAEDRPHDQFGATGRVDIAGQLCAGGRSMGRTALAQPVMPLGERTVIRRAHSVRAVLVRSGHARVSVLAQVVRVRTYGGMARTSLDVRVYADPATVSRDHHQRGRR